MQETGLDWDDGKVKKNMMQLHKLFWPEERTLLSCWATSSHSLCLWLLLFPFHDSCCFSFLHFSQSFSLYFLFLFIHLAMFTFSPSYFISICDLFPFPPPFCSPFFFSLASFLFIFLYFYLILPLFSCHSLILFHPPSFWFFPSFSLFFIYFCSCHHASFHFTFPAPFILLFLLTSSTLLPFLSFLVSFFLS